ncbi:cuticle protein CP14.6-like [Daphnia pulex]|uniref:cuticle protein CP14.6-like n=1 Tax=Daphnia pulex TaxID=6669 RepID=UPI001EE06C9A|nr:cuticle protein CP14.6-like [Daphnia pulex]
MKLFIVAALLAVAAAAPSGYKPEYKAPEIAIVAQSDVRNVDGSGAWSYAGSDGTTRDESYAQKQLAAQPSYGKDAYGKESYESGAGNTNKGASYYISPEGQKITLTWVADEGGFQPKGDHLPVAPVHEYELPVAPALPYSRTGAGF